MTLRQAFFYAMCLFTGGVFLALRDFAPERWAWPLFVAAMASPLIACYWTKHERVLWYGALPLFLFAAGLLAGGQGNKMAADSIYYQVGKNGVVTGKVAPGSWR